MDAFLSMELTPEIRRLAVYAFFWSGYAIWVGMAARLFVRPSNFSGPWTTLVLGFTGVAIGPLVVRTFMRVEHFTPMSPAGFLSAFVSSIAAAAVYYVFSFLFPKRDDEEDEEEEYLREQADRAEELEEKYEDVPKAELYEAFDRQAKSRRDGDYYEDRPRKRGRR